MGTPPSGRGAAAAALGGLSEHDTAASLNETTTGVAPTHEEFFASLGLRKRDVEEKLGKSWRKRATKNMRLNLELFERYGTPLEVRRQLLMGRTASEAFRRAGPMILERKLSWLRGEFGMTDDEAVTVLVTHPPFALYALDLKVREFMTTLMELSSEGKEALKAMILAHPQILGYGKKFGELAQQLLELLNLSKEDVAKVVIACPRILSYSITNKTIPIIEKMLILGVPRPEVAHILRTAPKLISRTFHLVVDEKLAWLESQRVGLTREQAVDILRKCPKCFYPKIESWEETRDWFLSCGKTDAQFVELMVKVDFNILGRKKKGLEEIMDFVVSYMGVDKEEVLETPEIFDAPFLSQTMCRIAFMDMNGKDAAKIPLKHLATASDQEFFSGMDMNEVEEFTKKWQQVKRDTKFRLILEKDYAGFDQDFEE